MPAGRPTLYKPEYCEEVVTFCAQGFSLTAFAGDIGVSRDTITGWAQEHEEFSLAVKIAKAKCARWWENKGRGGVSGDKDVNPTLCIFGLKNMAPDDWADKQETHHSGQVQVTKITREFVD